MENKVSYFFVGLFVFGILGLIFAVFFWLGDFQNKEESFTHYEIRTKESISGLSVKAPVRLLGVEVGDVVSINILSNETLEVSINIRVKKGTPIKQDTVATLQLQGITGLKYIGLLGGSANSPMLESSDENLAIIKFKESFLDTLDKKSDKLFDLAQTLDNKISLLLNEKNVENINQILSSLSNLSKGLEENKADEKFISLENNFNAMSNGVLKAAQNIDKSVANMGLVFENKLLILDNLNYSLIQNLELLKALLDNANNFLSTLNKSPSDILFKTTSPKLAPGEK